jgi:hypothetical protein
VADLEGWARVQIVNAVGLIIMGKPRSTWTRGKKYRGASPNFDPTATTSMKTPNS